MNPAMTNRREFLKWAGMGAAVPALAALGQTAPDNRPNIVFILGKLSLVFALGAVLSAQKLTPPPGNAPKINGPTIYGCRPTHPFLYRIPCTGQRPLRFAAKNLPVGLKLDPDTGIISGAAPSKGEYIVTLEAKNSYGSARKKFRIEAGDKLALTPPMGWNHWYTHYSRISDPLFRAAADAMISSGMADFGYQYVNMDDCWMTKPGADSPELSGPARDDHGAVLPNRNFPDLKALTDYIHGKGLKAGIYTSPGPLTCAKYEGAYEHEEIDARQFAAWGFDFLKYDWCSYGRIVSHPTLEDQKKPYAKMGAILKSLDRDVVFNLCQYGMGEVWKWGGDVDGHCWRTTGDLGLAKDTKLPGFYQIGLSNAAHWEHAGPGKWNDPDYILIGYIGNARQQNTPPKLTTLTPDEQYSYLSMWALMAAPLFYSGDMGRLDDFTLSLLCNSELIDVDQDALGHQAKIVRKNDEELILAKAMEDGSLAVGLFNLSEAKKTISASWQDLELKGRRRMRDVWRQTDGGKVQGQLSWEIAPHGVKFVRLFRK
jgi:alpha-galactosidase